ncbi:MAG: condensation domain-containing protein, partial [Myxococcota bacterium]
MNSGQSQPAYRLSPQQGRLATLGRAADVYRTQVAARVSGALDRQTVQRAADRIAHRHTALRLRLVHRPGSRRPLQRVAAETDRALLPVLEAAAGAALHTVAAAVRDEAIDLDGGPTARLHIGHDPDGDWLLLTLPALAADSYSALVILGDLVRRIRAVPQSTDSDEPAPGPDVLTTAAFFLEIIEGQDDEDDEDDEDGDGDGDGEEEDDDERAFWRELNAVTEPLRWPLDRPAEGPPRPAHIAVPVAGGAETALRDLAQRTEVSLEAVVLAAFQTYAHRMTGRDTLRIQVSGWARDYDELAAAVGPLRRWLPLDITRPDAAGDSRSLAGLARATRRALDPLREYELGFDPEAQASAPGLACDFVEVAPSADMRVELVYARDADHLLTLVCVDHGDRLVLALHYDEARIPDDVAGHSAAVLSRWLEAVAARPDEPLRALPLPIAPD